MDDNASQPPGEDDAEFAPPTVFPISATAVRQSWDRLCRRANLQNFRFIDLRHEAISRFFEMGLSVPEVALISGHRDVRMLFRYTHIRAQDVARKLMKGHPDEASAEFP